MAQFCCSAAKVAGTLSSVASGRGHGNRTPSKGSQRLPLEQEHAGVFAVKY